MTNRATLEALLARVLEGTGPDRELDEEIDLYLLEAGLRAQRFAIPFDALPYTASLDAALTLVPDGWSWSVSGTTKKEYHARIAPSAGGLKTFLGHWFDASTPPRALIAACLKARMEAQPLSNP